MVSSSPGRFIERTVKGCSEFREENAQELVRVQLAGWRCVHVRKGGAAVTAGAVRRLGGWEVSESVIPSHDVQSPR